MGFENDQTILSMGYSELDSEYILKKCNTWILGETNCFNVAEILLYFAKIYFCILVKDKKIFRSDSSV